jgi:hypothetical protein
MPLPVTKGIPTMSFSNVTWKNNHDEARRLCEAATSRLIERIRALAAHDGDPETYGEAWDRVVEAMVAEREAASALRN